MRARRDLSLAGRWVHSICILYENGSMGRVVCELLSTQNVGPKWYVNQFYTIMALTYRLLMNALLDEHRYGFGGSRADRGSKKRLNVSRNRLTLNFPL